MSNHANDIAASKSIRITLVGIVINALLAGGKAAAGFFGNSYALIADAIESAADVFSSLVVLVGIKLSRKPPDADHPYGHGKFEPLAAVVVALGLLTAAILIALESVHEIKVPHHAPKPYTLFVLLGVVLIKETLFRKVLHVSNEVSSTAVTTDAWHHRSDVITSLAATIGISIALIGGEGYESADDFAALLASFIIAVNAVTLLKPAMMELLDAAPDITITHKVREVAAIVPGVLGTHKCHVRKLGFDLYVELDVLCDPQASIRTGHEIAHRVGAALHDAIPALAKVVVHVEPVDDYGKRSTDSLGED